MTSDAVMLETRALTAGYGRVGVLKGIDLVVNTGEMVTLIGSNGAGKSTFLKSIVGLVKPSGGNVLLGGRELRGTSTESLVKQGVVLVPEGRMLFGPMSVAENLELGAYVHGRRGGEEAARRVYELFPVLRERAEQPAATLSGGEQQMLAVGRALMARPRLILLDEPSLGLAPRVIAEIFAALEVLREQGLTILLVEQDARLALKHADRGYVMRTGEIALTGSSAELLKNDDIRLIYLGGQDSTV
ncbi:MAG: ABC transporter ATP-binding protein [Actinobacteria bacterium HGW-Actinobacteria-10]|jgi:branched-chain amino acid transport system ATP-binding protein|nr:MAG: ABC transporter ATP-binding protein [Actinobacteria bacterium HGW-Actinobacteria-10]